MTQTDKLSDKWSLLRYLGLAMLILFFSALRLPALLQQPGGQDEQFYSIPGWTVWNEGIPRIPYLPTHYRHSFFEDSHRCLMAMPPGQFYAQAPFFAVFPANYATSRLPSFLGAVALMLVLFYTTLMCGGSWLTGLILVWLVGLSRPVLFTALNSRPDMLCVLCGILSWVTLLRSRDYQLKTFDWRTPLISGGLCGLGGLFHPVALVFSIQSTIVLFWRRGSLAVRVRRVMLGVLATGLVFSLWLPLIFMYWSEFRSQFFSNVLERSGPKLHQRLLWPFPSLVFQAHNLWELAGTFQCILVGSLFLIAVCIAWRLRSRQLWELVGWSVASCYVLSAVAGIHPTLCYWLYPYCMILLTGCVAISHACEHGARRHQSLDGANDAQESTIDPRRRVVRWPLVALAIAGTLIMIPGAGLRASWVYLRHYGDPKVDSRKFIAKVLEDLPKEGLFMVDLSYVFDVYMSGRETVLHGPRDLYWGNSADHYRYLLIAWQGEDEHAAQEYGARLERQVGDPNTIGHCYVNIYVPK